MQTMQWFWFFVKIVKFSEIERWMQMKQKLQYLNKLYGLLHIFHVSVLLFLSVFNVHLISKLNDVSTKLNLH